MSNFRLRLAYAGQWVMSKLVENRSICAGPVAVHDTAEEVPAAWPASEKVRRLACHMALGALVWGLASTAALAASNGQFTVGVNNTPGSPTDIKPGAPTSVRITLTNADTAQDLTDVAFTMPATSAGSGSLIVRGVPTITGSPDASACQLGTVTAQVGQGVISLSGMTIPRQQGTTPGICYIDVPITATSLDGVSSSPSYKLPIDSVTAAGGMTNGSGGAQSFTVLAASRPTWSKSFSPNVAVLNGADVVLSLTVSNPSDGVNLTGVRFEDVFPLTGGKAVIEPVGFDSSAPASCANASNVIITTGANAQVAVSGLSIAAGSSCTVKIKVKAAHTDGQYELGQTNTLLPSSFQSDQALTPAAPAPSPITVRSPLSVSKAFTSDYVASGVESSFRITLTNSSSNPLRVTSFGEAAISDLQSGQRLQPTGTPTNTCGGGSIALSGNGFTSSGYDIPAGGNCAITVPFTGTTASTNAPLTFTNSIPEGAVATSTPGIVSKPASATVTVVDELFVRKASTPSHVAPGNPVKYTVTVENYAASAKSNVHVLDRLQQGASYLTGVVNGTDYSPTITGACTSVSTTAVLGATGTLDFTIGNLPAQVGGTRGVCQLTFWAITDKNLAANTTTSNVIDSCGVYYGTAGQAATCNGKASETVNANYQSALVVEKTFNGSNFGNPNRSEPEGKVVTMRFKVSNYTDQPLTNLALADNLIDRGGIGKSLYIANPSNATSNCGATPTAAPGTTSVGFNGGTVPARSAASNTPGTCELQVDVVGPAGIYPNQATAAATQTFGDGTTAAISNIPSNQATLTYHGALKAEKSFAPGSMTSEGKAKVVVRLTNTDPNATLTGVSVEDPLPAAPNGLVLANPSGMYSTCAGNPSFTGAAGGAVASMAGATLPPGSSCDFIFEVVNTGTGTGNWVNTIPAGKVTANGGITNQTPVTATLTRSSPAIPVISKGIAPTAVAPGQPARLTIRITNGTQALTGLGITDHFTVGGTAGTAANGMQIASPANATTTCQGAVTANPGATNVALSGGSLLAGASCEVSVDVVSTNPGTIENTIPLNALVSEQGQTNSNTEAKASLQTSSSMTLSKQFTPSVIKVGERSKLRITFYNATIVAANNFAVTDNLPPGLEVAPGAPFHNCGPAQVDVSDKTKVVITKGALAGAVNKVSTTCYVEVDVTSTTEAPYTNTIPGNTLTVNGTPVDHPPATNVVHVTKPLLVFKAIDDKTLDASNSAGFTQGTASHTAGAQAVLTIWLENKNSTALTEASLLDSLPSGMVVAQTPNAQTTCANGVVSAASSGTSVRLTGATVPANGNCKVTVAVLSNSAGRYTNTIPSGGVTTKEGVSNEEPTSAELLVSTPPTVSKQFAPSVIQANGVSKLSIVLGNSNAAAIKLTADLVDTLPTAPSQMLVATPANLDKGSCTGTVTAIAGSKTVTFASGGSIPAGGCTITVDVTAALPGAYNNSIPAGGLQTDAGNNPDPANATLTVSTQGFISGKVFLDNNLAANGTFEQGTDTPLSQVKVALYSGSSCSGTLVPLKDTYGNALPNPMLTDAMGNYTFANLPAGTYSVCEPDQPQGTVNGITTAGPITGSGVPGTASAPSTTGSSITNIQLTANGSGVIGGSANNNFAEVMLSSIAGKVFLDQNNDGLINGTDSGIAGVTVNLLNSSGSVIKTTTTAADGSYVFDNLQPGTYSVQEPTQPSNTSNGKTIAGAVANGGTQGTPTPVTTTPSQINAIVLPPNTAASGNNFAEIVNGRTISGSVFLDYNNNGLSDGKDHGIANQVVELTGTDVNGNPVTPRTTTTLADGSYSFTGLPEGTYTVKQPAQPTGTTNGTPKPGTGGTGSNPTATSSEIASINLTGSNTVSAANNFPEIPGNAADVALEKTHTVSSFGEGSSRGFFILKPRNDGAVATTGTVRVVDTLPAGMTVAAPLPTGKGWTCTAQVGDSVVSCASTESIAGGAVGQPITLYVKVANGTVGQVMTNKAVVSYDNEPSGFDGNNEGTDTVTIAESAKLSGTVWRDVNHDRKLDPNEERVPDWVVEVLQGGVVVATTTTGSDGTYAVTDLPPGTGYEVRFRDPINGLPYGQSVTNENADGTNPGGAQEGYGKLTGLTLKGGDNIVQQSLPLDPSGVVYDSVTRKPIQGATVTLTGPAGFDPSVHVTSGQGSVVTGANGYYEFWLNVGAPVGVYTLTVSAPSYLPAPSSIIPACTNAPLNVDGTHKPEVIQAGPAAPGLNVPAHDPNACVAGTGPNTTQYYFSFILNVTTSGNVVNNHLPLDPILGGAIVVSKTSPKVNVTKGELVPYTITATNTLKSLLSNVDVQDHIPPGFRYRTGSATLNGVPVEPVVSGRLLNWKAQTFAANEKKTFQLLLMVGAGVGEGEYVNQAWALNSLIQERMSNVASATVRVVPDPLFDCSDLIGKVFDDKNANGYQDQGELGIPNVRVVTARGLLVTTDAEGRFHVACAAIPQADRGSNFVMKLDERTLPSGFRMTTENPRDVRVTRGKMVKLNFGATVHKVLRLEVDARAFAQDGQQLSTQWDSQLEQLLTQLAERPTVLRIAYRMTGEDKDVAAQRLKALTERIQDGYAKRAQQQKEKEDDTPPLVIETESFEQNKAEGVR